MPTAVLGSEIFEVVPTVQATGSSGGDPLTVSVANVIPSIQGGSGAPSGTPTYGAGTLYVDTTNFNLYLNTTGSTWVPLTTASSASETVTNLTVAGALYLGASIVSAAGTTQGTATALTDPFNVVTVGAFGAGVALPAATAAGQRVSVLNRTGNALLIYPASGAQIEAQGTNTAYGIGATQVYTFFSTSATQWYFESNTINTTDPNNIALTWSVNGTYVNLAQKQASIVAASAAINNANGNTVIQKLLVGATPVAGDVYCIDMFGNCVATSVATSSFRVYIGTAGTTADTLVTATAMQATSVSGTQPFHARMFVTFRTATSVYVTGTITGNGTTGITGNPVAYLGTAVTITNANNYITVAYQSGASSLTTTFQTASIYRIR